MGSPNPLVVASRLEVYFLIEFLFFQSPTTTTAVEQSSRPNATEEQLVSIDEANAQTNPINEVNAKTNSIDGQSISANEQSNAAEDQQPHSTVNKVLSVAAVVARLAAIMDDSLSATQVTAHSDGATPE